jgi:2-aminoadipate transaminase
MLLGRMATTRSLTCATTTDGLLGLANLPPPYTSQLSEYNQTKAQSDVMNFGIGQPSPSLLPLDVIRKSLGSWQNASLDPLILQYGYGHGFQSFRTILSDFLTHEYQMTVRPEDLLMTCGNSQALDLATRIFIRENDVVAMEEPSYFLAKFIFEMSHCEVMPIPLQEDGLDVELLRQNLMAGKIPKLLYTIPNYHNPTGVCLSEKKKRELVDLAAEYRFLILADEPYNLLHFDTSTSPPTTLMHYDEGRGVVIACGSFSKILSPGLRLGWIHAHSSLIERVVSHGVIRSGGGLNPFVAFSITEMIKDGGLKQNIHSLNSVLSSRRLIMCNTLTSNLPANCTFHTPQGGYFVWVVLPPHILASSVLAKAEKHSVKFTEGSRCSMANPPNFRNCVRLSFAFYSEEEIQRGVETLCLVIREVIAEGESK